MSHVSPVAQRLRLTFGKSGPLIYTSNLDTAKIWERVLRRAHLPILYTKGFNTRPRISLAMPLPLGVSSDCEILEISLRERIALRQDELRERLLSVSPAGLTISAIVEVDMRASNPHALLISAEYRIQFLDEIDRPVLQRKIDSLLGRKSIIVDRVRRRKRSVMDIRPLILGLQLDGNDDLLAHLSVGERGNLRPDHLLEHLGLSQMHHSVHRFKLHMLDD